MQFALAKGVCWICREAGRVSQLRIDSGTRGTKADCEIPLPVHRCAAQPAPVGVRLVSALLVNSDRTRGDVTQLKPAQTGDSTGADTVSANNRLMIAEVPVGSPEH